MLKNINKQKGFIIPLIIAIIAILAIGSGVYLVQHKKVEAPAVVNTSDWKTYTSSINGFEISYPSDWSTSTSFSSLSLVSPEKEKMLKQYPNQPAQNTFDINISIHPYAYRSMGIRSKTTLNNLSAEQVINESEAGRLILIYLDHGVNTYEITAPKSEIENKILSTFEFITPSISESKLFLKNMQDKLGVDSKISEFVGYKNMPGYRVDLSQDDFNRAVEYLNSNLTNRSSDPAYTTERSTGFTNNNIICFSVGLGAGASSADLPYIWCADLNQ